MKIYLKYFKNTYKFYEGDINKFCLRLQKGVYPYKHRDGWEKFNKTSLLAKKEFYSNFKMETITHAGCKFAKRV